MSLLEQLALGLQSVRFAAREWRTLALWLPFAALLAVQCAILAPLAAWAHPLLSWAAAPWIQWQAGPGALHYPEFYRHLPALARRGLFVARLVAEPVLLGVAVRAFAWRWRGQPFTWFAAWREVWPRAGALVLVMLPLLAAVIVAGWLGERVLAARLTPLFRGLLPGALAGWSALLHLAWAYAVALVVLDRRDALGAWRELPHTWARGAIAAAAVIAIGALMQWPADWLLARAPVVAARGLPELVWVLVGLRQAVAAIVSFLATGALTLVWVSAVWRGEERA